MTDGNGSRVHEGEACTGARARPQVSAERDQNGGDEVYKAGVTHEAWKCRAPVPADFLEIERFEVAIMGGMKRDEDCHEFAQAELPRAYALPDPVSDQLLWPPRLKAQTKVIDMTEQGQYAVGQGASCEGPVGLSTDSLPQRTLLIPY